MKRIYKNDKERIINPCIDHKGYQLIDLIRKPKRVRAKVHRTVAECFTPNPGNKPFVDHINEDKRDNVVENLRWATYTDNQMNISAHRSNNTSGYKGITAKTHKGIIARWRVRIGVDNRRIELGTYKDIEEAIKVRQDAVKLHFGEFAPK